MQRRNFKNLLLSIKIHISKMLDGFAFCLSVFNGIES